MKTVMLTMLAMTVVLFSGCRCPMQCAPEKVPAMKVTTVTVDANQNFVVNDKVFTVEEFFAQAEFEPESKLVYLDVESQSAISEKTVIKAIRYLESHDYRVSMMEKSKYAHLNSVCR